MLKSEENNKTSVKSRVTFSLRSLLAPANIRQYVKIMNLQQTSCSLRHNRLAWLDSAGLAGDGGEEGKQYIDHK
jgi:hypothetical protein